MTLSIRTTNRRGLALGAAALATAATLAPALAQETQTINVSIGELIDAGNDGVTLDNGVTAFAEIVSFGTGEAGPNMGDSGDNPAQLGSLYNGTLLPGAGVSNDPAGFTRINSENIQSLDDGANTAYSNGIGFHISFDTPLAVNDSVLMDIDGAASFSSNPDAGNAEWATQFGFSGDTFRAPTVSTSGADSSLAIDNREINGGGAWSAMLDRTLDQVDTADELPETLDLVYNTTDVNGQDPDDLDTQALFSYGAPLTDYYAMWGLDQEFDFANIGVANSGISAINVDFTPVPEPASLALLGLGGLGLLTRRRNRA